MTLAEPVNLGAVLASFEEVFSPRIPAQVNDHDVRVAHLLGDYIWHLHENSDEFFLVLTGSCEIGLRDAQRVERSVRLGPGDTFVVPAGTLHRPRSDGADVLMFVRTGTLTTGDLHEGEIPAHVDSTTGHHVDATPPGHRPIQG